MIVFSFEKLTNEKERGRGGNCILQCNLFEFVMQMEKKVYVPDERGGKSKKGNRKSEEKIEKMPGSFFSIFSLGD